MISCYQNSWLMFRINEISYLLPCTPLARSFAIKKNMRYTEDQITACLKEYKSSGVSKSEFAKNKPFHPTTLYNWISSRNPKSPFREIRAKNHFTGTIEIRRNNGGNRKTNQITNSLMSGHCLQSPKTLIWPLILSCATQNFDFILLCRSPLLVGLR